MDLGKALRIADGIIGTRSLEVAKLNEDSEVDIVVDEGLKEKLDRFKVVAVEDDISGEVKDGLKYIYPTRVDGEIHWIVQNVLGKYRVIKGVD